jgi:hypothetical protein
MAIISRQKIKLFKLFLVSPILEKILLILYICLVPLLAYYEKFGNDFSDYFLANTLNTNGILDHLKTVKTLDQVKVWISEEFVPNYFTQELSPNKPIFAIYGFCNEIENQKCELLGYKNFEESCSTIQENLAKSSNITHNKLAHGDYGSYNSSLCFQISRDYGSTSTVSTIVNESLAESTAFISIQSIFFNYWDNSLVSYKINFEFDGAQKVRNYIFSYDVADPSILKDVFFLILYTLFIIQLILFSLKILFEFSIMPNKYTFVGHVGHFILQYIFVFWLAFGFGLKSLTTYSDSLQEFLEMEEKLSYKKISKNILNLVFLIYPFRVISFLSWNKQLSVPVQVFIALYRTAPVLCLICLVAVVFVFGFSLATFLGFKDSFYALRSFTSAILNYPSTDLSRIFDNEHDYILNSGQYYHEIIWVVQTLFYGFLILYLIVILIDVTRRAFSHEFAILLPNEQDLREKQEELQSKFDKLLKELNVIFGKNKGKKTSDLMGSQEKMVIWLEYNVQNSDVDEILERLDDSIKFMIFYKPDEVEAFLRYLFRLKPNLLNSQAGSRFRIVVETIIQKESSEKANIQALLEWLKGVGCRVPFLLYLKESVEKEVYVQYKKKYQSLYACEDKETTLKFCRMEEKLDNLVLNFEDNQDKYVVLENSMSDISDDLSTHDFIET